MLYRSSITSLLILVVFASCGPNSENESTATEPEEEQETTAIEPEASPAVCVWDKLSVRETAGDKAKWITSLSIGKKVKYLNRDSAIADKEYSKIEMNDGKTGWVRNSFIAVDAKPAAMLEDTDIYNRPDLLTKADKKFSSMDIVAIIKEEDGWMRIKGKRSEGKWIEEGWVKPRNVSVTDVDIAVAKFAKQALANESTEQKLEALQSILDNSDLAGSSFSEEIMNEINSITEMESPEVEESQMDETFEIEVDSASTEDSNQE